MLTGEEKQELETLEEGKWTMSGYGPNSEERLRLGELRRQMWEGVELSEFFIEGDVSMLSFNRKDPYENIGYTGVIEIDYIEDCDVKHQISFNLDYMENRLDITRGGEELIVEQGSELTGISTQDQLLDYLEDYFEE